MKTYIRYYKKCIICGNNIFSNKKHKKTCGENCFMENRKNIKRELNKGYYVKDRSKYIERSKIRAKSFNIDCIVCGKNFMGPDGGKYCNKECMSKDYSSNRLGIDNPGFKTGIYCGSDRGIHNYKYVLFNKNCKKLDLNIIKDKGELSCEVCGINNSSRFEHHHIMFRSEFPKHKNLHDIKNILYLCIKCHNNFHKNISLRDNLINERGLKKLFM